MIDKGFAGILVLLALCANAEAECPAWTHKTTTIGSAASLPEGFAAYGLIKKLPNQGAQTLPGLWRTPLQEYSPQQVPGTESHYPASVDISEDGRWFVYTSYASSYYHTWLVPEAGGTPLQVDTTETYVYGAGYSYSYYPNTYFAGFLRHSPTGGTEIWYTQGDSAIVARAVDLSGSTPVLGAIRKLMSLSYPYRMYTQRDIQVAVVGKHILAGLFGIDRDHRTAYLTIPDSGLGTATSSDIYQFATGYALPDSQYSLYGCGHALSPDGRWAVSNSGNSGDTCVPSKWSDPDMDHKGFMMVPFPETTAPAMSPHQLVLEFGRSINWVPEAYRYGDWDAVDFNNWYFANDDKWIIGGQNGYESPARTLWVVDWSASVWYPITPLDTNQSPADPAMFVGHSGTVYSSSSGGSSSSAQAFDPINDPRNPVYHILAPNGGETLSVNTVCTLRVHSLRSGNASVFFRRGSDTYTPAEINFAIDPLTDTLFTFTPPESVTVASGTGTRSFYLSGDGWKAYVRDYGDATFNDASDGDFVFFDPIHPPSPVQPLSATESTVTRSTVFIEDGYALVTFRNASMYRILNGDGRLIASGPLPAKAGSVRVPVPGRSGIAILEVR